MKIKLFNKIADAGINQFDPIAYEFSEDFDTYDAIMVRSAKLHDVEFPADLKCIARAGAGVNNIPLDRCSEQGIVVFNTPGANANAVKELVMAGLLMSSRKITKGIEWVKTLEGDDISKAVEKEKAILSVRKLQVKSWALSDLVRLAYWLPMPQPPWIWRFSDMIRSSL